MRKTLIFAITMSLLISATACNNNTANVQQQNNRAIVLKNDNSNEERNRLLSEDIKYFTTEFPKLHKNPFSIITEQDFNDRMNKLGEQVDQLTNTQVFAELNKIIASIGDAHTSINYSDGYTYPIEFYIFEDKVYVVNADKSLESMMFSQVIKINNIDINTVIEQLTTLIPHENESWLLSMLPQYLQSPVFMYGLGIIPDENSTIFTVEKDGKSEDYTVSTLEYGKNADFINTNANDVFIGLYDKYYDYKYLPDTSTVYFEYNVCADMESKSFKDFNNEMFDTINTNVIKKIIIDLRNNSGGNSEILNPFTQDLKSYISKNPNLKVYTLVGRQTFSSGMFAIYRIKESAPSAISIGEPTGGALDCYGEIKGFNLPNSGIPITYSTKYFEFSKDFSYKNDGIKTFLPDIVIQPTIDDYMEQNDVVRKKAYE